MYKLGLTNLDAVDASPNMLEKAKEKGVYKNLICARVGPGTLDILNGKWFIGILFHWMSSKLLKPYTIMSDTPNALSINTWYAYIGTIRICWGERVKFSPAKPNGQYDLLGSRG